MSALLSWTVSFCFKCALVNAAAAQLYLLDSPIIVADKNRGLLLFIVPDKWCEWCAPRTAV